MTYTVYPGELRGDPGIDRTQPQVVGGYETRGYAPPRQLSGGTQGVRPSMQLPKPTWASTAMRGRPKSNGIPDYQYSPRLGRPFDSPRREDPRDTGHGTEYMGNPGGPHPNNTYFSSPRGERREPPGGPYVRENMGPQREGPLHPRECVYRPEIRRAQPLEERRTPSRLKPPVFDGKTSIEAFLAQFQIGRASCRERV